MANCQRDRAGKLVQHFEEPKQQVFISLTPKAIAGLDALAQSYGVKGRSAFLELLGRGMVQITQTVTSTASSEAFPEKAGRHDESSS
jgi:hypothetical protein